MGNTNPNILEEGAVKVTKPPFLLYCTTCLHTVTLYCSPAPRVNMRVKSQTLMKLLHLNSIHQIKKSHCPDAVWLHCACVCVCVRAVCVPVPEHRSIRLEYILTECPRANALENRLASVRALRKCGWAGERKSDGEFAQVCDGCVCECIWGLVAKLALWNSHVALFGPTFFF